jgi:inner membrane protein
LELGPLSNATIIACLIVNQIGALLPDIDQASNQLWELMPEDRVFSRFLNKLFGSHRTLSHSILGLVIIYKISEWLIFKLINPSFINPGLVSGALMIGYLSHLFLDLLTEEGLPLLFPIKWKFGIPPIKALRIKSGKWGEKYIIFPLILVYIIWFTITRWPIFD